MRSPNVVSCRALVSDVWYIILDKVPAKELLALSQTCHAMKDMVTVYSAFAFSLPKLTQAFILYEDVGSFRRMLRITGGIITSRRHRRSGRGLPRLRWNWWSRGCGKFRCRKDVKNRSTSFDEEKSGFCRPGVHSCKLLWFDFGKWLALCSLACVINYIMHDTVYYSLYPWTTFCARRSILWGILSLQEQCAAENLIIMFICRYVFADALLFLHKRDQIFTWNSLEKLTLREFSSPISSSTPNKPKNSQILRQKLTWTWTEPSTMLVSRFMFPSTIFISNIP